MLELRINGFGGQGAVTLAHLLAQAALENGEQGQALPFFGVERRGAPVRAAVRMSPTTIHAHSQCELPDYLVIMSEKLTQAAINEGINDIGTVIINAPHTLAVEKYPTWQIDADAIAHDTELFSADGPLINIPLFGAVCRVLNIPPNIMEQTILNKWPVINNERNLSAAGQAYSGVKMCPPASLSGRTSIVKIGAGSNPPSSCSGSLKHRNPDQRIARHLFGLAKGMEINEITD